MAPNDVNAGNYNVKPQERKVDAMFFEPVPAELFVSRLLLRVIRLGVGSSVERVLLNESPLVVALLLLLLPVETLLSVVGGGARETLPLRASTNPRHMAVCALGQLG